MNPLGSARFRSDPVGRGKVLDNAAAANDSPANLRS